TAQTSAVAARVYDNQLGPARRRVLQEGRRDGVVLGRTRTDHDDAVALRGGRERRRDRPRIQALHQRRHRGGVAKARAVVDVVGAEALPDQLLEQIGFLVRTLGGAKPGDRPAPETRVEALAPAGAERERLLPSRFAEIGADLRARDLEASILLDPLAADQRLAQAIGMVDVIEPKAALDAQPIAIGGPVTPIDVEDAV